jgi:hypothetical protein
MTYIASIDGTYKSKVYVNLILFKIVRGWRTDRFKWSYPLSGPDAHLSYSPVAGVPLSVAVDIGAVGASFHLKVLSADFPVTSVSFSDAAHGEIHWAPWKGVTIDATVSITQVDGA